MDATFDVNFLTPIRGHDEKGQDFEMTAMLAGRGKLVVFFERDGIVDRKEKQGRNFELERRDGRGTGGNLHLGVPPDADQGSGGRAPRAARALPRRTRAREQPAPHFNEQES